MRRFASILVLWGIALLVVGCKKQEAAPEPKSPETPPAGMPAPEAPAATAMTPPSAGEGDATSETKALDRDGREQGADETKGGLPGGSTKDEQAFTRLEDAEAALAKADQELRTLTPVAHGEAPPNAGRKPPASKPAPSATPLARGEARCENACKAMDSLRRAADAVCRLTSKTDAHCKKAQKLVKTNEERVAVCQCSGS